MRVESVSKSKTPPPKSKSTGWAMNNQPLAKGSVAPSLGRYFHRFLLFPCSFSDTCPVCTTCQNAGTRAEERAKTLKPKTKSADEVKAVTLTTHSILSGSPSKNFARWFSSTIFGRVQKKTHAYIKSWHTPRTEVLQENFDILYALLYSQAHFARYESIGRTPSTETNAQPAQQYASAQALNLSVCRRNRVVWEWSK